jgi:hypothetical protein
VDGISTTPTHLTPDQLASRWSSTTGTLKNWRFRGIGPVFTKLGKLVLYAIADVETFEAKHRMAANSVKAIEFTDRRNP